MKFEIYESSQLLDSKGPVSRTETDTWVDDETHKLLVITQRNGLVKWIAKYDHIKKGQSNYGEIMYVSLAPGETTKEIMNNAIANVIAEIIASTKPIPVPLEIRRGGPHSPRG